MTKKEMYNLIAKVCADNTEIVDFCNHEIELLDKKRASGNKKANESMERNVALVYNTLAEMGKSTTTDLIASGNLDYLKNESGIVTTQKVASYLNKLVAMGKVTKSVEKKKTYFEIVE